MRVEARKIYFSGGSSYIITLPKKWVEDNGLKAGDSVVMHIGRNTVCISPQIPKSVRKEVVIDAKGLGRACLVRRIISCYLAGYDSLRIKVYNEEHRKAADLAADTLIGAEIMEDLGKVISMEVFLDDRFRTDDVLERMGNMCIAMLSDFCSALKNFNEYMCNSIILRENEIDRLHFLVLRQVNLAVQYREADTGAHSRELFGYWTFARRFERIADHAANMARNLLRLGRSIPELCDIVEPCLDMLKMASIAFFRKDTEIADAVLTEFEDLKYLEERFYRKIIEHGVEEAIQLKSIIDSLTRIAAYSADMAEIALDIAVEHE
ncbi:phosphate uptake regulator PhoU [Archaeoglobus veneficus]|uniref:Phosphate uptake regulator, PhoU n=1 Tax=Archaeoglobus veneficus (strain DSM 11195 / SNP6) TaxID=693661 RepID=F2KSB6_ARCVS|nr:phosphate uptake regulator PhoU [Archaeoglobus veneficus]AEA46885.1 phosphate uptake regulator, PhoU [Archaeoglobus veneficus SNP6]